MVTRLALAIGVLGSLLLLFAAGPAAAIGRSSGQTDQCPALPAPTTTDTVIFGQLCQVIDGKAKFAGGVQITVSHNGTEVASQRTDPEGRFTIVVPEPTTYRVALDPKTLPKDFALTDARSTVLPAVDTSFGSSRALFPLGAGASSPGTLHELLQLFASGVKLGLIIGVAACGLSLIFGSTGLVNFAHGELVTLGALLAFLFSSVAGFGHLWLIWATLLALVGVGIAGLASEVFVFGPLRRRRTALISQMVVSIGLSLFLRNIYLIFFGGDSRSFRQYAVQQEFKIGPFSLAPKDWAIIVIAAAVLIAVTALIKFSRLGTAMRAVSDDRDLAEASGIDVDSVIRWIWVLGAAMAGLGGVFYGLTQNIRFDLGWLLLLALFAAVILGGLGNAYGAIVGGLVIGIVQEVATYWIDTSYEFAVPLGVLVIVLLFRPQGLLSRQERFG